MLFRSTSREGSGASAAAYTANSLNQYTAITREEEAPFAPGYDADGNQTKIQTSTGEWEVSYNALNQAARFIQGNRRVECRYDYLNRRIEKAVYEGEVLMSKKRFIYHGYLQIAELDAADATETAMPVLRKTYLWDPLEPVATRILAMSLFDETGTWAEDLYYTHDLLKNATALFGIRAGRRALYEYGPYGNILRMEGNAAEDNPFRFSSEYADDELGLVYYNYRYYNPQNGRWISRDPVIEKQRDNVYTYAYNTPSILIDARGQFAFAIALFNPIGVAVVAAAAVVVAVATVVVVAEKVIDEINSDTADKAVPETAPIAIPQKPKYGNCSKRRHSELNKEVGRKCKGPSMHCKNKNICKDEIERNIKRFQDCIDARTKINNECFNEIGRAHV